MGGWMGVCGWVDGCMWVYMGWQFGSSAVVGFDSIKWTYGFLNRLNNNTKSGAIDAAVRTTTQPLHPWPPQT